MPTNTYDLIVIGDEIPGLVAATLCARRGLRVLVLESGDRPASYQLGPHRLPVEPLSFAGFASPAVRRVLDELHFQHLLKRKLRETSPSFQYVAPDVRADIVADDEVLRRELDRELRLSEPLLAACARAGSVSRLFDPVLGQDIAVPPSGFWERREIGRIAGKLEEEAQAWQEQIGELPAVARPLFALPGALATHADPAEMSPETQLRAFDLWRRGVPRLVGDSATMREAFTEKFASHNGELRIAAPAELTFGWGKVTGVRLEDGEELGAHHVIAAMPVDEVALLAEKKLGKRLRQSVDGLERAGYRYVLNLVVREVGVPEGMASTVLLVDDPEAPLSGDNAIAIHVDEPDAEARVLVTAEAVCPAPNDDKHLDDAFADLRVKIRERLESVMPFFSEHVLVAHSPHEALPAEGIDGELELEHPVPPRPRWRSSLESVLGISALPYSVGIKNLSMASSQILPGLGIEGQFGIGWCAAKIACTSAGKRKDYKDQVIAGG